MRLQATTLFLLTAPCITATTIPPPILSTQNVTTPEFIGSDACPHDLGPKSIFHPRTAQLHQNGNTGSTDSPSPIQAHTKLSSAQSLPVPLLWADDGTLTGVKARGFSATGLAAYDPETLAELAAWEPEQTRCTGSGASLNIQYSQLRLEDKMLLTSCQGGWVFVVGRRDGVNGTQMVLSREIDVRSELGDGEGLLSTAFDVMGNIWFTSGALMAADAEPVTSATVGFIRPDGFISTYRINGEVIENGMAVDGTTAYVITGPPPASPPNTPAYMYSFKTVGAANNQQIKLDWKSTPYPTGSENKPGRFAAGAGGTPALLGPDFIATTDNDDLGMNLLVYHRALQPNSTAQLFCQIRLFETVQSTNDNRVTVHHDGSDYRVVVQNMWAAPNITLVQISNDTNGDWNDMSGMPGGIVQVRVSREAGGCSIEWRNLDIAVKGVSILATKTGIYYAYVQDRELARQGQYVWYIVAIDWDSGVELWRRRTGAGGSFNDQFASMSIGNGRLYQIVRNGTVWIEDQV